MMVKNLTEFIFKSYYKIIGYTKKDKLLFANKSKSKKQI